MVINHFLSRFFAMPVTEKYTGSCRNTGSIIMAVLILFSHPAFAEVTATLERESIHLNDTVRLIIKSDDPSSSNEPDLSVLEQNFKLLGTSVSQNISIVNGQQQAEKSWISEIEAKAPGSFTIPPIQIGSEQTRPLRLTVLPESNQKLDASQDFFVEFEIDNDRPFVQQQVIATIRLYLGASLIDGSLSDPVSDGMNMIRMGQDTQYRKQVDARYYRVIERKIALFPTASGIVDLGPIRFQGMVEDSTTANQTFSSIFRGGTRVSARSAAISMEVQPPDPGFIGRTWLPAKSVSLSDRSSAPANIYVGQPFTLELELAATALASEQLPEISLPVSDSYKQYPDQPARETALDNGNVVSILTRKIAVIPSQAGTLTIPEISVNWWNTETSRMETASLPARDILVSSNVAGASGSGEDLIADQSTGSSHQNESVTVPFMNQPVLQQSFIELPRWSIWLIAFLALGWIATTVILFRKLNKLTTTTVADSNSSPGISAPQIKELKRKLLNACNANDAARCRYYLLEWAELRWPGQREMGLADIAAKFQDPAISSPIRELDAILYSGNTENDWNGDSLLPIADLLVTSPARKPGNRTSVLPDLYLPGTGRVG